MDRRLSPASDRTALRGVGIARETMTDGRPMRIAAALSDLRRAPQGARDRQLLLGADVTVIHLMGHLMERQLDKTAGTLLQSALESRGQLDTNEGRIAIGWLIDTITPDECANFFAAMGYNSD